MKSLKKIIEESENQTSAMVNNDSKQFYFVVTPEKAKPGWKFVKYSTTPDKVSSVLKSQGYKELNEALSLKKLVKEANDYSDADSGSGLDMNPNKSELNDSTMASIEYTFTAPDGSKIEIEVDKSYHIMGISSDKGQATEARFELKAGNAHGISAFRQLAANLTKNGFKVSKKDSMHKEFDPLPDEDKWRNH